MRNVYRTIYKFQLVVVQWVLAIVRRQPRVLHSTWEIYVHMEIYHLDEYDLESAIFIASFMATLGNKLIYQHLLLVSAFRNLTHNVLKAFLRYQAILNIAGKRSFGGIIYEPQMRLGDCSLWYMYANESV